MFPVLPLLQISIDFYGVDQEALQIWVFPSMCIGNMGFAFVLLTNLWQACGI